MPGRAVAVEAISPDDIDRGIVAHYGDPLREQRLLATGAGIVDRSNRGVLSISGADRLSWLHDLTTQHLAHLPALTGTETLGLSAHGHVEHHAVLLDDATTTWLDVEPGAAAALLEFLDRMRFLLRVQPSDETPQWTVFSVVGPATPDALASLIERRLAEPRVAAVPGAKFASGTVPAHATTQYDVAVLAGGGFVRRMSYGADLLLPRDRVAEVIGGLNLPPAGIWAFEALRVAHRRPRWGRETDHRTLPAEVGWMAAAVHLEKGCYRGQETVARVHHLGRAPRRLVLLHLDGIVTDELPAPATAVTTDEGRPIGYVGTATRHYEWGPIALAVVKQSTAGDAQLRIGPNTASVDSESSPTW
jgi:tRNA-modifying protein YgfZ